MIRSYTPACGRKNTGKNRNRIITWPITANITPSIWHNIPTNTSGCLPANVKTSNEQSITNTIFMALNREVWIDQVKEGFYPDDSFLQKATDYSQFVDHNRLHIASAGIDPKVLVNNTTYPISVIGRDDEDAPKRWSTATTNSKALSASTVRRSGQVWRRKPRTLMPRRKIPKTLP